MDVANILGSITSAISVTKELVQIDKAFDEAQWKLKLAELTTALADAKIGLAELRDEIQARDSEIAKLKEAFGSKEKALRLVTTYMNEKTESRSACRSARDAKG